MKAHNSTFVPQADPGAFVRAHRDEIDAAIDRVLSAGQYILGPEVEAFENEFAAFLGAPYVVSMANGTEALWLACKALGIGPGDEVVLPSLTATATGAAVVETGARPVFADVRDADLTLDPEEVERRITPRTRAVVPVHLYGQPAQMAPLSELASQAGFALIEDCAQAHGAQLDGKVVGTFGQAAAFSFYPTKNLGALGDGGAVATNDRNLADRLRLLRQYGWQERYSSESHGWNSRLDELQAAVLRVKLKHLPEDNARRVRLARLFDSLLPPTVRALRPPENSAGVYHLYVIRHSRRDELRAHLRQRGIGSAVHYPVPVHLQPAYKTLGAGPGSLPVTEGACAEVLSLPLYPEMTEAQVRDVSDAVADFERMTR